MDSGRYSNTIGKALLMEVEPPIPIMKIRLFIGLIVFTLAEVFSGASPIGLIHPFILLVTYPLYFTHFFVIATIAQKYHHTRLRDLYFFGCIYGLYEGFITKVIWFGYGAGENGFASGSLYGLGIHETIGTGFFWHPVMSFLLPIYISLLLLTHGQDMKVPFDFFKETDNIFHSKWFKRGIIILLTFMLCGNALGLIGLVLGLGSSIVLLWYGFTRWIRPYSFTPSDLIDIYSLKRKGMIIGCAILSILYVGGYFVLVPDKKPSMSQVTTTLGLYLFFILLIITTKYTPIDQFHSDLTFPVYKIWKILRFIWVVAFLISFLFPLNIVLFLIGAISLIPFGVFLLMYFILHSRIGGNERDTDYILI